MTIVSRHPLRHNDDDYVDAVRIDTIERYKTSGLSGDEWRFSVRLQFLRKGQVVHEKWLSDIKAALAYAPWGLATAGEGDDWTNADDKDLCFQPGCTNNAVSEYELKEQFAANGYKLDPSDFHGTKYRRFCQRHLTRGDCGREDSDDNYKIVSGPGPDKTDWSEANVREAARVEVRVDSLADLPGAINSVRKEFRPE